MTSRENCPPYVRGAHHLRAVSYAAQFLKKRVSTPARRGTFSSNGTCCSSFWRMRDAKTVRTINSAKPFARTD